MSRVRMGREVGAMLIEAMGLPVAGAIAVAVDLPVNDNASVSVTYPLNADVVARLAAAMQAADKAERCGETTRNQP